MGSIAFRGNSKVFERWVSLTFDVYAINIFANQKHPPPTLSKPTLTEKHIDPSPTLYIPYTCTNIWNQKPHFSPLLSYILSTPSTPTILNHHKHTHTPTYTITSLGTKEIVLRKIYSKPYTKATKINATPPSSSVRSVLLQQHLLYALLGVCANQFSIYKSKPQT